MLSLQLHGGNLFMLPSFFYMMLELQVRVYVCVVCVCLCVAHDCVWCRLSVHSHAAGTRPLTQQQLTHMWFETTQARKRKFSIVFRTFGLDGKEVAGE